MLSAHTCLDQPQVPTDDGKQRGKQETKASISQHGNNKENIYADPRSAQVRTKCRQPSEAR